MKLSKKTIWESRLSDQEKQDFLLGLEIHEYIEISNQTMAIRVPGGWIYKGLRNDCGQSVFVPEPVTSKID